MAVKIVIDAGHGGANPGAVYGGRREKDDVLSLALAVGEVLEQSGVDVYYTRVGDVYESPYERQRKQIQSGRICFFRFTEIPAYIPTSTAVWKVWCMKRGVKQSTWPCH